MSDKGVSLWRKRKLIQNQGVSGKRRTFLCELLSFAEQAVEDGTEVGEQPLAVLQQLQRLRVGEVGRAVKQRRTCTTDTAQMHKFTLLS